MNYRQKRNFHPKSIFFYLWKKKLKKVLPLKNVDPLKINLPVANTARVLENELYAINFSL